MANEKPCYGLCSMLFYREMDERANTQSPKTPAKTGLSLFGEA
jgi:hypothetical protein